MSPQTSTPSTTDGQGFYLAVLVATALAALVIAPLAVAGLLFGVHHAPPPMWTATGALLHHPLDPRAGLPPTSRPDLPGTGGWLASLALTWLALAALGEAGWKLWKLTDPSATPTRRTPRTPPALLRQASRQATTAEAKRLRPSGLAKPRPEVRPEGLLLGRAGRQDLLAGWEDSLLVLGPPRSGKTTSLIIPSVVEAPGTTVVTSTRPDVLAATAPRRPSLVFDPAGLLGGNLPPTARPLRWDLLAGCQDLAVARRRARALASGSSTASAAAGTFFDAAAQDLLGSLLCLAALARIPTGQVPDALTPQGLAQAAALAARLPSLPPAARQRLAAEAQQAMSPTVQSVLAVARQALSALADPRVAATVSPHPDARSAEALVLSGLAIHVLTPPDAAQALAPLLVAFVDDLVAAARRIAAASPGRRLDPPLLLLLDEAANIAPLPDIGSLASAGGGDGIVLAVVLQSLGQAEARWGAAQAQALVDASTVRLVLPGLAAAGALADIARLAGTERVSERSVSTSSQGRSTTTSERERDVLDAATIRSLPRGQALLLWRSMPPAVIQLVPSAGRGWPRAGDPPSEPPEGPGASREAPEGGTRHRPRRSGSTTTWRPHHRRPPRTCWGCSVAHHHHRRRQSRRPRRRRPDRPAATPGLGGGGERGRAGVSYCHFVTAPP